MQVVFIFLALEKKINEFPEATLDLLPSNQVLFQDDSPVSLL